MGIELLLGIGLGFVVLGPRRMHSMLGILGQAKARFDKASGEIKAQLRAELDAPASRRVAQEQQLAGEAAGIEGGTP